MKYYILDTTLSRKPLLFETVDELVHHLEGTVWRKFKLNRATYMDNIISLGYGYDDDLGSTFATSLAEHFDIGVIREGRLMRTNVHEAARNLKYRNEQGN